MTAHSRYVVIYRGPTGELEIEAFRVKGMAMRRVKDLSNNRIPIKGERCLLTIMDVDGEIEFDYEWYTKSDNNV